MQHKIYKYLKFIRFKDVFQWDVKRYIADSNIFDIYFAVAPTTFEKGFSFNR